jgi:ornithine decarboxylase
VLEKIGHLCDYVLWDEAGSATTPSIRCSKTTARCARRISAGDAGTVLDPVRAQAGSRLLAGSQIHKRDEHISGQPRYVEHKRFNESFLMNASTSPFYPLFASLDVNAKVHEAKAARCCGTAASSLASSRARSCASSVATIEKTRPHEEQWFFDPSCRTW